MVAFIGEPLGGEMSSPSRAGPWVPMRHLRSGRLHCLQTGAQIGDGLGCRIFRQLAGDEPMRLCPGRNAAELGEIEPQARKASRLSDRRP